VPVEEETYLDIKPAREAFGTAYLAVVEAINAILIKNGVTRKQLSKSVNGYRTALRKYLEGDDTQVVKDTIKVAEKFIEKLGRYTLCSLRFASTH